MEVGDRQWCMEPQGAEADVDSLHLTVEGQDSYRVERADNPPRRLIGVHKKIYENNTMLQDCPRLEDVLLQGVGISEVSFPLTQLRTFRGDMHDHTELTQLLSGAPELTQVTLWIKFAQNATLAGEPPRPSLSVNIHRCGCLQVHALPPTSTTLAGRAFYSDQRESPYRGIHLKFAV